MMTYLITHYAYVILQKFCKKYVIKINDLQ